MGNPHVGMDGIIAARLSKSEMEISALGSAEAIFVKKLARSISSILSNFRGVAATLRPSHF